MNDVLRKRIRAERREKKKFLDELRHAQKVEENRKNSFKRGKHSEYQAWPYCPESTRAFFQLLR